MTRDRKHLTTAPVNRSLRRFGKRRLPKGAGGREVSGTHGRWRPWLKVLVLALLAGATVYAREAYLVARGAIVGGTCSVSSVIDGDTVRLYCPGRGLIKARLMGFDTPEVFSPSCITEFWLGTQATWTLRKKLWFAKDVDIVLGGQDRYERRLATLLIDGKSVAEAMISLGLAKPYRGGQRSGWC